MDRGRLACWGRDVILHGNHEAAARGPHCFVAIGIGGHDQAAEVDAVDAELVLAISGQQLAAFGIAILDMVELVVEVEVPAAVAVDGEGEHRAVSDFLAVTRHIGSQYIAVHAVAEHLTLGVQGGQAEFAIGA